MEVLQVLMVCLDWIINSAMRHLIFRWTGNRVLNLGPTGVFMGVGVDWGSGILSSNTFYHKEHKEIHKGHKAFLLCVLCKNFVHFVVKNLIP